MRQKLCSLFEQENIEFTALPLARKDSRETLLEREGGPHLRC